ncbi:hypothetical protein [Actinoplanes palleronii]|uniref:Uncharacterized protein n=1 Tax=Actinoplanes palleronii TaxID=113570 RepID=A0ABQ4BQW6_9ACTN|nr:hypothetical protein [Actinoplanes palleronii]GIE73051.1 hypothetical protein Apa02nite_091590 [Actinoplanes palleronii]
MRYSTGNAYYAEIAAFSGTSCSGAAAVVGQTHGEDGKYLLSAFDNNYGFNVYTAVKSVASNGCHGSPSTTVTRAQLSGHNLRFWINFRGVNSDAHNLPAPGRRAESSGQSRSRPA